MSLRHHANTLAQLIHLDSTNLSGSSFMEHGEGCSLFDVIICTTRCNVHPWQITNLHFHEQHATSAWNCHPLKAK